MSASRSRSATASQTLRSPSTAAALDSRRVSDSPFGFISAMAAESNIGQDRPHVRRAWAQSRILVCRNWQGTVHQAIRIKPALRTELLIEVSRSSIEAARRAGHQSGRVEASQEAPRHHIQTFRCVNKIQTAGHVWCGNQRSGSPICSQYLCEFHIAEFAEDWGHR